jgi:Domain of unknown function (DUF397)
VIDNWRKATYSADNSTCVETGWANGMIGYRDTKQATLSDTERPILLFSQDTVRTFLAMIKIANG